MSNLRKIKLARKLIEDSKKYHYVKIGKKRIYRSVCETKKLIKGGEKLLDIGGSDPLNSYSFKEYTTTLCDVEYNYKNRHHCDIRLENLPFDNNTFDIVTSHETIEHLWILDEHGMLSWDGIINFWKESHRVLKPNGTLYVSTRNRACPFALLKILKNAFVQVSFPSVGQCGHANELCAKDLRDIASVTDLFASNRIFSTSSFSPDLQSWVNKQTPRVERFLKRKLLQEELYDTIHFISKKL